MNTKPSNAIPIRSRAARAFAVALLTALLPHVVHASIRIEEAQREFQARYHFVTGGYVTWPECACGTPAPAFPPDEFYGDLDHNPALGVKLVNHLVVKFYEGNTQGWKPLYTKVLPTPDGITGIAGQASVDVGYPDTSFPKSGSNPNFNFDQVTTVSYPNEFDQIKRYIKMLNCVFCFHSMPQHEAKFGEATKTDNCSAAKDAAASAWSNDPWHTPGAGDPAATASTYSYNNTDYYANKFAIRCRFASSPATDWPRLTAGKLLLFLKVKHLDGGIGGTSPPVTGDSYTYQLFGSPADVDIQHDYLSPWVGNSEFSITSSCPPIGQDVKKQGWSLGDGDDVYPILKPDFNTAADYAQCGGAACASCGGGEDRPGKVTPALHSLDLQISLGPNRYGRSAGYFYLHADQPSPALFTPATLLYSTPSAIGSVADLGEYPFTQNAQMHIQPINGGYQISFTDRATSLPLSSVTITPNSDPNQVVVTEVLGSGQPRVIVFTYFPNSPSGGATWQMSEGNGLRVESRSTLWTGPADRTDTNAVSTEGGAPVAQTVEQYHTYPWGQSLVQRTVGAGASAQTTSWTNYDNPVNDGGKYGHVKQVVEPGGRWEQYTYDTAGRLTKKLAQFGNNILSDDESANRVTQISYNGNVILTTESLLGNEVSRNYQVHTWDETDQVEKIQTIRCVTPNAPIDASANLTNIVWRTTDDVNTPGTGHAWDTLAELRPDGTMTFYGYYGPQTIVQTGDTGMSWADKVNWTPVNGYLGSMDGTQTTTTVGDWGETTSVLVEDLASSPRLKLALDQYYYDTADLLRRSHTVTHLDTTTEAFTYSCCGLGTYRDRDWATTEYLYDAAKRQTASKRLDILTTNVLDAAGNVLKTTRIGTDLYPIVLRRAGYDLAGRLTSETNALAGVTSHTETFGANGRTVTTVYPDTGTRIEAYNKDGSLRSVTGTAVFPLYYDYSVDTVTHEAYTKETKGSSTGSEWTKTYTDMLGRAYKTVYASASGAPSTVAYFNALGQLTNQVDPDGVTMLFAYNSKGEQSLTVLDTNRDNQITYVGPGADRITFTTATNEVATAHDNTVVRRTSVYVWSTSANASNLVSTVETSADGLNSWSTVYRDATTPLVTESHTAYASFSGARTVMTINPDQTKTISHYQYGRLVSVTRLDSTAPGVQIASANYGYDPQGRQNTVADARNGTSTYTFNDADQVVAATTPTPGPGQAPQTTTTAYDTSLRAWKVTQPDGTSLTNEFYATGQLKKTRGSRTYPVGYGYDYAGRMSTMTNWSGFPNTGARVTAWTYNPYRGWLDSKTYAGNTAGPAYTYKPAGRLLTRQWARGLTTTYTYDNAGGLATVTYSGGATPGLSYTYDRLGRQATITQGSSAISTLAYNDVNQLLSEHYTGGVLATLFTTSTYDGYLRRTALTLSSPQGTLNSAVYAYDDASRLKTVTANTGTLSAEYDYLDNSPLAAHVTFKQGTTTRMTTTKQYDHLNRLTSISSAIAPSAIGDSYAYNAANQRIRSTLADGSYWLYEYDALGQVRSGRKYWPDQTPVAGQQFEYAHDDIGNRTQTKAGGDQNGASLRSAAYWANSLNQYTNRDVPGAVDVLGISFTTNTVTVNSQATYRKGEYFRKEVPVSNGTGPVWQAITVSSNNQPIIAGHVFVQTNHERFFYDADGNLTNDGRWAYIWDAENRLVSMTNNTSVGPQQGLKFEYDWIGRRIHKQVWSQAVSPTNDVKFLYDGWKLLAELNATNNTVIRSYVWGSDLSGTMQGAGGVGGLLFIYDLASAIGYCAPAFDGNGNVAALVSLSGGTNCATYEYGPFGEVIRATGPMARVNPFRWSTQYTDDETDLVMYPARPYSPSTGRWLSRDPLGEQGGKNLYGFLDNDPANYVDVLGEWKWYNPYSWIYDPDDYVYYPPLPLPPRNPDFQDEIDAQIDALSGRSGGVQKLCKTISTTANTALEFTPQNTFSEVVLGETLGGEKVSGGRRVFGAGTSLAGGFVITKVVGKTVTICCGKKTICLFVQRHHLIPKARFKNHDLIKAAGVDIYKDPRNLMDLAGHGGDHTDAYYDAVQALLDAGYEQAQQGKMTPAEAYEGVCKILRQGITDGSVNPYKSKDVFPIP